MIGQTFGKLTVVEAAPNMGNARAWVCSCVCGNTKSVRAYSLNDGNTTSCGCASSRYALPVRNRTHGMTKSKVYGVWRTMRTRCENKNDEHFARYGARGIKVCDRWRKFENFLEDMGEPPPGLTIERKDNNGDYDPSNCIWATPKQQSNNKRTNIKLTSNGITKSLEDWANELGISYMAIYQRLRAGWAPHRILQGSLRHGSRSRE